MALYEHLIKDFKEHREIYWAHLSRLASLLIILNISLFFVSNLVNTAGYFYTYYSLILLGLIELGMLLPLGCLDRLSYYFFYLILLIAAGYFLIASVIYWIQMSTVWQAAQPL